MTDIDNDTAAAEALKTIRDAQARAGDDFSRNTWGYDITYSVLAAGMVGAQALAFPLNVILTSCATVALCLLAASWARRHGVRISGIKPKKARWVAYGLGAVFLVLTIFTFLASAERHQSWVGLITAPLGFGLALIGSRMWRTVYRREMGLDL